MLAFRPDLLFNRLGKLEWYDGMLRDWIDPNLGKEPQQILDVGCATGYLSAHVHAMQHRVTGLDRSASMIAAAEGGYPDINFIIADACSLPFPDHSFDVVASASLVNLVPDQDALLAQMVRVCRPGGIVTLLFPVSGFTPHDLNRLIVSLGIVGFSEAALRTWHARAPALVPEHVAELLEGAGCVDIENDLHLGGMVAAVTGIRM